MSADVRKPDWEAVDRALQESLLFTGFGSLHNFGRGAYTTVFHSTYPRHRYYVDCSLSTADNRMMVYITSKRLRYPRYRYLARFLREVTEEFGGILEAEEGAYFHMGYGFSGDTRYAMISTVIEPVHTWTQSSFLAAFAMMKGHFDEVFPILKLASRGHFDEARAHFEVARKVSISAPEH